MIMLYIMSICSKWQSFYSFATCKCGGRGGGGIIEFQGSSRPYPAISTARRCQHQLRPSPIRPSQTTHRCS